MNFSLSYEIVDNTPIYMGYFGVKWSFSYTFADPYRIFGVWTGNAEYDLHSYYYNRPGYNLDPIDIVIEELVNG